MQAQHPNAIYKRKLFPAHLGIAWNEVGANNIAKKDYYKQLVKNTEDKKLKSKYKGLETTYKFGLNGGYFGKTIDRTNWQYGPEVGFGCTIGNQFEILMLIEMLELGGIHCISSNTDGLVCLFNRNLTDKYYEICQTWEKIVGNDVQGKLEYQEYVKLIQENVNTYYAIKPDGEVKAKGRFAWIGEIHKNNSDGLSRIERKALHDYYGTGIPVEDTITSEKNIHMFLIGKKASKSYRFETYNKNREVTRYQGVIRYYVSLEGEQILKIKNEGIESNAADVMQVQEGNLVTVLNRIEDLTYHFSNINYNYYISGAKAIIDQIARGGKKVKPPDPNQINLFN